MFADLDLSLPMAVNLTPDLANSELYAMYNNLPADHTPMIDYSSGYMSYPIYETSTPSQEGPFLYMPQDISPDSTTPRQATFARNSSNIYQPTSSDEERRVSTTQGPTRYVSSSQFPETPLSVDPSGLGGDRRASYANHGLDAYDWANRSDDENEEKEEEEEVVTSTKLEVPSPTKPPLSPISDIDSNIQPLDVPVSVSPQKGGTGPPRGQRRARTVGGSYH
jgi:hypothetical protein